MQRAGPIAADPAAQPAEEAEAEKLLVQETAKPEADDATAVLATDNSALQQVDEQAGEQVDDFSDPFLPTSFDAPKASRPRAA